MRTLLIVVLNLWIIISAAIIIRYAQLWIPNIVMWFKIRANIRRNMRPARKGLADSPRMARRNK